MTATDAETRLAGIAAAPGLAVGPAHRLRLAEATVQRRQVADPAAELLRLNDARRAARGELEALQAHVAATVSPAEAEIFEAHLVFLDDPSLFDEVEASCRAEGCNVEAALATVVDGYNAMLLESDDELFRARAEQAQQPLLDILQVGGVNMPAEPVVLLATDLLPSTAVQLDRARLLGFCLAEGGPTAHVAILARGLGLPAVVGVGAALDGVPDGATVVLDGGAGALLVNPSAEALRDAGGRIAAAAERRERERAAAQAPAVTRDGAAIAVLANLSSLAEAEEAVACGAEGVGLLRTELLFMDRDTPPTEEEQLALYGQIAAVLAGRPLVIRTLDIGGDKPVPYLRQPPEQNPALGVRGVRLGRGEPELLRAQVRAIWRIGPGHHVKVMFPMVASIEEVHWLRGLVHELGAELREAGVPVLDRLEVGVMVEVPALAVLADHVARLVDFMSVGTNDLTQYALAVDRTNAAVSGISDALHPAVLRLIAQTVRAGASGGAQVSVCGELAGDPLGMLLLAGMGLRSLSMSPPLIPAAKSALRAAELGSLQDLAERALAQPTAAEVRRTVAEWQRIGA
jgi:multiphosphoryl transfer protein